MHGNREKVQGVDTEQVLHRPVPGQREIAGVQGKVGERRQRHPGRHHIRGEGDHQEEQHAQRCKCERGQIVDLEQTLRDGAELFRRAA